MVGSQVNSVVVRVVTFLNEQAHRRLAERKRSIAAVLKRSEEVQRRLRCG